MLVLIEAAQGRLFAKVFLERSVEYMKKLLLVVMILAIEETISRQKSLWLVQVQCAEKQREHRKSPMNKAKMEKGIRAAKFPRTCWCQD